MFQSGEASFQPPPVFRREGGHVPAIFNLPEEGVGVPAISNVPEEGGGVPAISNVPEGGGGVPVISNVPEEGGSVPATSSVREISRQMGPAAMTARRDMPSLARSTFPDRKMIWPSVQI